MMDTVAALRWSRTILKPGGWLLMDDFVGPTRWQWSERSLAVATSVLTVLPERFFAEGVPREVSRPNPERLAEVDPSEAADSGNILPGLDRYFPEARIIPTGGCIYHLALGKVLGGFRAEDDALLKSLLLLDDELTRSGETHYAVALAQSD
jgi:hypothetical protein